MKIHKFTRNFILAVTILALPTTTMPIAFETAAAVGALLVSGIAFFKSRSASNALNAQQKNVTTQKRGLSSTTEDSNDQAVKDLRKELAVTQKDALNLQEQVAKLQKEHTANTASAKAAVAPLNNVEVKRAAEFATIEDVDKKLAALHTNIAELLAQANQTRAESLKTALEGFNRMATDDRKKNKEDFENITKAFETLKNTLIAEGSNALEQNKTQILKITKELFDNFSKHRLLAEETVHAERIKEISKTFATKEELATATKDIKAWATQAFAPKSQYDNLQGLSNQVKALQNAVDNQTPEVIAMRVWQKAFDAQNSRRSRSASPSTRLVSTVALSSNSCTAGSSSTITAELASSTTESSATTAASV